MQPNWKNSPSLLPGTAMAAICSRCSRRPCFERSKMMLIKIQIITGAMSILLLYFTFEMIRKEKIREEYSILWLFTGVATLLFCLFPDFFLAKFLVRITGLFYLSAVVVIVFCFLLLIVLHFSVVISQLTDKNKEIAQRFAILELELREWKEKNGPG
ncbi:MAG TPA: hypothetical protein DCZ04_06900 [Syntrophorhabdus aromaticivorans]|nr:hypothetical protein [Syntrophorhabdus aromaticivorans]